MGSLAALCLIPLLALVASITAAPAGASGSLDPTFGQDGRVTTDFGKWSSAHAIAIQSDGRIVVAGHWGSHVEYEQEPGPEDHDFSVGRYLPSGRVDQSFGRDGLVATDVGGKFDHPEVVLALPDGRILVAGSSLTRYVRRCCNPDTDFALVMYEADGRRDQSFGDRGRVLTDFRTGDGVAALAIQTDGRILAGGWSFTADASQFGFALARYQPDGSLDDAFGTDGKVITEDGRTDLRALTIQMDGRILAAGSGCCTEDSREYLRLIRYNPDGSLDTSFGDNGMVSSPAPEFFHFEGDMHFAPDGSILASGFGHLELPNENCSCPNFAVVRFDSNGVLDQSFGRKGVALAFARGSSYAYDIAIRSDGTIVAAGVVYFPPVTYPRIGQRSMFAVARFNSDGSRDQSFGRHGKVTTRFDDTDAIAWAVAIDGAGRAVAAGIAGGNYALTRYLA